MDNKTFFKAVVDEIFGKINYKLLGIMILVLTPLAFHSFYKTSQLKKNKKMTVGIIYYCHSGNRGGSDVEFIYKANNKIYKNSNHIYFSCSDLEESMKRTNHYYQTIYDSLDPENSDILIAEYQYKDYSVPIPDSLYYYW